VRICVYCSSSDAVDEVFVREARELGHEIGSRHHELVYGGACIGLMGELARAATAAGGRVTGVIPRRFAERELTYTAADEVIITESMAERKALMIQRAEAFVALPGGFGTLEEISEVLTLKQLGDQNGALVLVDLNGFYAPLMAYFEQFYTLSFARPEYRALYYLAPGARDALDYIEHYVPVELPGKWFPPSDANGSR
jgi:uncharacterized protein (TIGR00730 family)